MSHDWLFEAAKPLDESAREAALARQGQLTKPPGSLGRLEALAVRLAAQQGQERPDLASAAITVFAADHGIAAEGVSAFPQEVTGAMIANFAHGGAAISVLAAELGARLEVVDVGAVNAPGLLPGVVSARQGAGSANLAVEAAMDVQQLSGALAAGREALERAQEYGAKLFIGGEMGIANTSVATAIGCALLGRDAASLAGPGTGLDAAGVSHKAAVIDRALALHRPHCDSVLETLRRLGGFEVVALAGAYIAAAQQGVSVLVDGFIASAAALAAVRINPGVAEWLFLSHASAEPGHAALVEALCADGVEAPLLDLGMRLGEGSGAAVALPLLRSACALHNRMATFAEAGVADGS